MDKKGTRVVTFKSVIGVSGLLRGGSHRRKGGGLKKRKRGCGMDRGRAPYYK